MRKPLLLPLRAPFFRIIFTLCFQVFSGTAPGHIFCCNLFDCVQNWSIWGPRQNPVGTKMAPQIDQVAPQKIQRQVPGAIFDNPVNAIIY